jgi:hypothetical protein
MTPRCIITGIAVISPHDPFLWVPADLFDAGEYYLINGNVVGTIPQWIEGEPFYSRTITLNHTYFEKRGVFLIHKTEAVLNAAAEDYLNDR